ncbi:MAG: hypothetical protein JXM73_13870 [Anaerolineae bacterium]|nr:hypothetical protein [Anaerolineae bacterium]
MAHIHSQAIGGYYPLPPQHLPALASLFTAHQGGRLLDPCAGEGNALQSLAEAWGMTPYANEIDADRAAACRARLGAEHAVEGDIMTLRTPNRAYSLVYCNPPYAENAGQAGEKRREFEMLAHSWKWAQDGGFVLWVVYAQHMTERAASFLVKHSSLVDVYRLPGLHLDSYTQILVVAKTRPVERGEDTSAEVLKLVESCKQPDRLPELAIALQPLYAIPPAQMIKRFYFHPDQVGAEVMLPALAAHGAQLTHTFRGIIEPPPPAPALAPIVPPRAGQLGMLLAAGLFNGLLLDLEDGPAAVRGVVRMAEIDTTPPDLVGIHETIEHRAQVTISLLHKSGKLTTIEGQEKDALVAFLKEHRQAFLDHLTGHSEPLYDFDYSPHALVFDRVFRNRPLPGRPVTGLFETQKHVVASMLSTLEKRRRVILAGDMGTGKGPMGATAIAALWEQKKFRPGQVAVVMAPPHLIEKWQTELIDAIPGCHAHIADKGPGAGESETLVDDVAAFMCRAEARPDQLHVLVLSRERAKLGEGWQPAYQIARRHFARWPKDPILGTETIPRQYLDEEGHLLPDVSRIGHEDLLICPTCSALVTGSQGEDSKADPLRWLATKPRRCKTCGGALWQLKRTFSAPKPGEITPRRNPRYPIATLLRERYSKRVAVVVCDELHENKSAASDQGRAMQDLVLIADYAIGMTGTLMGGLASSLFWLEWAFNPARMVKDYPLDEGIQPAINRWVRSMGVMVKVIEYKQDKQSGVYSGTDRHEHKPEEAPGISPLLIRELIDHVVWVGLPDLAFNLPEYTEIPIPISLPPEIQAHYTHEKSKLLDYLLTCRDEGDASFLGAYLQAVLRYPSTCYQARPVFHRTPRKDSAGKQIVKLVTTLQGFDQKQVYPKEQALLDLLTEELAANRPCAVFIAQSGKVGIQERLLELITRHVPGARPVVLESNTVATDKRGGWLEKQIEKGGNVLICNPKLVETGLDLLAFKSLIFYEVAYSLYTVSQASRRHWRIGQTDECRVYHLFYENTMEAQAIELVSQKQAAAALLGGDADGGGLAQISGGAASLEAELARSIAADETVVDVSRLFRQTAQASADFTSGWASGEKTVDESRLTVVPLDNLVGKRFYHDGQAHQVVDYGPLDQAAYQVRNLSSGIQQLLAAALVQKAAGIPDDAPLTSRPITGEAPARAALPQAGPADPAMFRPTAEFFPPEYHAAKRRHPDALVLVDHGHTFQAYGEDARAIARAIGNVASEGRIPTITLPNRDRYWVDKLTRAGLKIAIVREQAARQSVSQPAEHSLPATAEQAYARFREAHQRDVLTFVEMADSSFMSFDGDAITAAARLFRPTAVAHWNGGPTLKTITLRPDERETAIQRLLKANCSVALANERIEIRQPDPRPVLKAQPTLAKPAAAPQPPAAPQQAQFALF